MINVVWITIMCVLITDVLQFWTNFSPYITKWITKGKFRQAIDFKLFQCSTCQSFWLGLIYIICAGLFSIQNMCIVLLFACCTPIIASVWFTLSDCIMKVINMLQ